jgi:hypothetical protein
MTLIYVASQTAVLQAEVHKEKDDFREGYNTDGISTTRFSGFSSTV